MTTMQQPLGTPFSAFSTATDVMAGISLSGHVAIVTGGNSGIGFVTAKSLASAGAQVIVPTRDPGRAQQALAGLDNIEVRPMDLMVPASIAAFCEDFLTGGTPLPLLVHSAGVMAMPLARDAEGHEAQFATNHLGHYRLTCGLWPALKAAGAARVVSVSSRGHQIAGIDFDDIDFLKRPYDKWVAYGQSKTANALFALALDRRGRNHGVRAFSLHPGQILTNLARHLSGDEIAAFDALDEHGVPRVDPLNGIKTLEQGAATTLWCATSPALNGLGGVYCEDCDIAPLQTGLIGRKGVVPWAADVAMAERLWTVSAQWTGLSAE